MIWVTPAVTLLLAECIIFPELEQECVLPLTDRTMHLWQGLVGWYLSMPAIPPLSEHGNEHRWTVRPSLPISLDNSRTHQAPVPL